jgi:hypothetical protein
MLGALTKPALDAMSQLNIGSAAGQFTHWFHHYGFASKMSTER